MRKDNGNDVETCGTWVFMGLGCKAVISLDSIGRSLGCTLYHIYTMNLKTQCCTLNPKP